uniref:Protein kinase domain-containing protein n=1 Tax=Kalanchoe fedtschenkoi TaxID=63787 RepID=A0A7N0ZUN9_KALFE
MHLVIRISSPYISLDELLLLQHPKFVSHPHIVKLMGYCYENGRLGAVYDLQLLNSLVNLISDDDFTWGRRIKFAFELADLLKYLHSCSPPYLLRNLYPINILVDKAYNPKLFNFGMLTGGVLNDKKQYFNLHGLHWMYYTDRHSNTHEYYTEASDVYSYGMVLLNLITKLTCSKGDDDYEDRVRQVYEATESRGRRALKDFSLADGSFFGETDFDVVDGQKITMLAMQCIYRNYCCRPSIDRVVKCLKKLKIMKTVMQ